MSKKIDGIQAALAALGLTVDQIRNMARFCGFAKRNRGKIHSECFVFTLTRLVCLGTVSCNDLAAAMQAGGGACASRQAVWQRIGKGALELFTLLLAEVLHSRCRMAQDLPEPLSSRFRRILVQDSTLVRLPSALMAVFSGVANGAKGVCNARVQAICDLKSGRFVHFSIDSYSRNDAMAAADLEAAPGDLVLRDRGYSSAEAFQAIIDAKAHLLCRYKHGVALLQPDTLEPLDLLALLRNQGGLDIRLKLGLKGPVLRLVAGPVDTETANLRRMKLKRETKGHKPSRDLLALCDWTILLTTLCDPSISLRDLLRLYGLRWRIECVFKTWKSHLRFAEFHQVSEHQARLLITARLLAVSLLQHALWLPLRQLVAGAGSEVLSLMKFIRYICSNPQQIAPLIAASTPDEPVVQALIRYCKYDKRKRPTYEDHLADATTLETRPAP